MIGIANIFRISHLEEETMYVMLNKILCDPLARSQVAALMHHAAKSMEDCVHYSIMPDGTDTKAIWVFEVWPNEEAHVASLRLPTVGEAIQQARPYLEGTERVFSGSFMTVARNRLVPN